MGLFAVVLSFSMMLLSIRWSALEYTIVMIFNDSLADILQEGKSL